MHVYDAIFKYMVIPFLHNDSHKTDILERSALFQTFPITDPKFCDKECGKLKGCSVYSGKQQSLLSRVPGFILPGLLLTWWLTFSKMLSIFMPHFLSVVYAECYQLSWQSI